MKYRIIDIIGSNKAITQSDGWKVRDLIENAIYISGESDGKFDDIDYILFYGKGTATQAISGLSGKPPPDGI